MFREDNPFQLRRATPNSLCVDFFTESLKGFRVSHVAGRAGALSRERQHCVCVENILPTWVSTNLRLRVAIQVSTAIKGHVSSSVENSVGTIAETENTRMPPNCLSRSSHRDNVR